MDRLGGPKSHHPHHVLLTLAPKRPQTTAAGPAFCYHSEVLQVTQQSPEGLVPRVTLTSSRLLRGSTTRARSQQLLRTDPALGSLQIVPEVMLSVTLLIITSDQQNNLPWSPSEKKKPKPLSMSYSAWPSSLIVKKGARQPIENIFPPRFYQESRVQIHPQPAPLHWAPAVCQSCAR